MPLLLEALSDWLFGGRGADASEGEFGDRGMSVTGKERRLGFVFAVQS